MSEEIIESFSEELQGRIKDLAKKVNDKLGIETKEVLESIVMEYKDLKEKFPDREDITVQHQSWVRVQPKWMAQLNSDAEVFEGIIYHCTDAYDPLAKRRRKANKMFKEDKEKAIEEGLTDEEGNVLSEKGNVLSKNTHNRNIFGICTRVKGDDEPKRFWQRISGYDALNVKVPVMEAVRFRGSIAEGVGPDDVLTINPVRNPFFNKIKSDEITPERVINSDMIDAEFVELSDIPDLHDNLLGYRNRYTTEGFVSYVNTRPNEKTGNMRFVLSDNAMDEFQITVWVPEHLHDKMDFEKGSKVWVYGTIGTGEYNDEKTYNFNATGLHAYEDYKIESTEFDEEVKEDDDFSEVY